jgi:hypothetical protein
MMPDDGVIISHFMTKARPVRPSRIRLMAMRMPGAVTRAG